MADDNEATLRNQLAETRAELKVLQDADKEAKRKSSAATKAKEAEVAEQLAAITTKYESAAAKLEVVEKRTREAADKVYKTLPDAAKKRADLLKDKLSADDYLAFVEQEVRAVPESNKEDDAAPPGLPGSPTPRKYENLKKNYKPKYEEFAREHFYTDLNLVRDMLFEEDPRTGNRRFKMTMHQFKKMLEKNASKGVLLSRDALEGRQKK